MATEVQPILDPETRLVCSIPESLKIWFADYARRHRTSMSEILRSIVQGMKQNEADRATQEK